MGGEGELVFKDSSMYLEQRVNLLNTVVLSQGLFCSPENMWQCLETFFWSQLEGVLLAFSG